MWIYILILSVIFIIVLIVYLFKKKAGKPAPSSVFQRNELEKMLERELIPKIQLKEEAEKEDFRYRDDYKRNVNDMTGRAILEDEYKTILQGGIGKYKAKDFDGAELEFSKVIESDTANAAAYYYRGLIKNKKNEYAVAVNDFDLASAYGFTEPDLHFQRGLSNLKLKLYNKAASDFSTYLALNPGNVEAHFNKGLCEAASERFQEAISEFTRTIELSPNYEQAYYERGKVYLKLDNKENACNDFKVAYKKGCLPANYYVQTLCNGKSA